MCSKKASARVILQKHGAKTLHQRLEEKSAKPSDIDGGMNFGSHESRPQWLLTHPWNGIEIAASPIRPAIASPAKPPAKCEEKKNDQSDYH